MSATLTLSGFVRSSVFSASHTLSLALTSRLSVHNDVLIFIVPPKAASYLENILQLKRLEMREDYNLPTLEAPEFLDVLCSLSVLLAKKPVLLSQEPYKTQLMTLTHANNILSKLLPKPYIQLVCCLPSKLSSVMLYKIFYYQLT